MKRILVPVDGSDHARDALKQAFELFPDAEIHALHVAHVTTLPEHAGTSPVDLAEERGEEILAEAERIAAEHDRDIVTSMKHNNAARGIQRYADENDIDHIVMGSKGRSGLERVLLGSVAETVVRRSDVPVTVVR